MKNLINRFSLWLAAVFILSAVLFSNVAQASLLDMIRAWVTINPLAVEVSAPKEAAIDKNFKLEAKAINQGEEKIENGQAEIFLSPELVLIGKEPIQEIKIIPGKKEKKIVWQVKGEKEGSYIISVKVSGELKGQVVSAEDSAVVEIKESLNRGGASKWLKNLFEFFQKLF